jgi:hypothetical protein
MLSLPLRWRSKRHRSSHSYLRSRWDGRFKTVTSPSRTVFPAPLQRRTGRQSRDGRFGVHKDFLPQSGTEPQFRGRPHRSLFPITNKYFGPYIVTGCRIHSPLYESSCLETGCALGFRVTIKLCHLQLHDKKVRYMLLQQTVALHPSPKVGRRGTYFTWKRKITFLLLKHKTVIIILFPQS